MAGQQASKVDALAASLRSFVAAHRGEKPYQWRLPYGELVLLERLGPAASAAGPAIIELGRFVAQADYRAADRRAEALERVLATLKTVQARGEPVVAFVSELLAGAEGPTSVHEPADAAIARAGFDCLAALGRGDAAAVAALTKWSTEPGPYRGRATSLLVTWGLVEGPPLPVYSPPPALTPAQREARVRACIETLRHFIDRHGDALPPGVDLPATALDELGRLGAIAAAAQPTLVELARVTDHYSIQVRDDGSNAYAGQDLLALSRVVRVLGEIGANPLRAIPWLQGRVDSIRAAIASAPPLAFWSTDDRYDREESLRSAMQRLVDETDRAARGATSRSL
jgi:hypothetical protein